MFLVCIMRFACPSGEARLMTRIHIVVDEEEKERFRCCAEGEGKTLSEWLREAAREKLRQEGPLRLDSLEELRAFFASCDARERRDEPDWEEHRRVIEASTRSGVGEV